MGLQDRLGGEAGSGHPTEPITLPYASSGSGLYHCGPLTYTKMGLAVLFAWLLWGDFCFTLMEAVVPAVLPLKLKALGASNTLMSIILSTLPGIMNMTICPWVSSASDRYRSRWGRRIPFIISTMPFLTVSLLLLGWSENLTSMLQGVSPALRQHAPATVTITLIAVFMAAFQFFNMFVNSVFWYLFNDVVPPQFLGRFMGLFRIFGSLATILFNFLIYPYAGTHMRQMLIGAAIIYFFGFGMMCLRIKEGPYPPPPEDKAGQGIVPALRAFFGQSFSARFYWYFYLWSMFGAVAGACEMFRVFYYQEMGLTLDHIGQLNGYSWIAALVATYLTAVFVDRWHPLRVRMYLSVFSAATGFAGLIWVVVTDLPASVFFWLSLGGLLVGRFSQTLSEACDIPVFMRLMPKTLYGQFSSANAVIRTVGVIVAGLLVGAFMDFMKWLYNGSDFAYRWFLLWWWVFSIVATVFVCMGYREWKRLGGDEGYRPPAPWRPEGFEEVADKVKSGPLRPHLVMVSMWLSLAAVIVNILLVPVFMHYMKTHEMSRGIFWYAAYFIPIKLALAVACYWQLVRVRADIRAQEAGRRTRYGVPHHGVLMVNAIQGLVNFPVYWYQMVRTIQLNKETDLIWFGIANLLGTAGAIVAVQVVRWVERDVTSPRETSEQAELPVEATGADESGTPSGAVT